MQAMIDGANAGSVFVEDASYAVRMISTSSPVNDPSDLENIFLKTSDGKYVPMSTIATLTEEPIAPNLSREQQRRIVSVSASLDGGYALSDAYSRMLAIAQPLLPEGDTILPLAEAKTIGDSNYGLAITFGFALLVILLVLAAQFESVYAAVIVMVTVPFGLACAVYAVWFTGGSLNIYSQIGLILVRGERQHPPAAGGDDNDRDGAGRRAAGGVAGRWCRGTARAGLDHRGRPRLCRGLDAVPDAGRLFAARPLQQAQGA